jgi:hypothetical protein
MKLSRRKLLQAALGATQLGLLSRFAGTAHAAPANLKATKLLTLWIGGGCHWESFFAPFTSAGINKFMVPPTGGVIPHGYKPSQVENFDRSAVDLDQPGLKRKLRGPVYWNWANHNDTTGVLASSGGTQNHRPWGYAWADPTYKIYERIAVLVGADQNTAAHTSGIVASMCGVAGATFRAPAIQAVVANALAARFPDRPLANVSLGGMNTTSLDLPSVAAPVRIGSPSSIEPTLSDKWDSSWLGLRTRTMEPNLKFDGSADVGTLPLTRVDAALLKATRGLKGKSSSGADGALEQLYETYKGTSKTLARDVVAVLGQVKGFEHLKTNPEYPINWSSCIGYADSCGGSGSMGPYDLALQLLKSNLVTSVSMNGSSFNNTQFDTHSMNGPQFGANHLRIAFEQVGRMLIEMQLTPGSAAGKSLLDETIVYVYSDFGRTFPKQGSDHHPATCAILAGGSIIGNQMVGGYDETMNGSPLGVPVKLIEEGGQIETRPPRSQDVAATVINAFGLEPGTDFFIPGGYGVFDGVIG